MISNIQGVFFDGQSSKPNLVSVYLNEHSISFATDNDPSMVKEIAIKDIENIDFSSTGNLQLKFGEFPFQTLMIEGADDIAEFRSRYPSAFSSSIYSRVLRGNVFKVVASSFVTLVGVLFIYIFFVAPFIAEKAVILIPKNAEIALGEKMTEPLFASLDIDESKSKILTDFFNEVGFESGYPLELYVVDDPIVNAFAVPGGKIVIYQGILDVFDSWEQLAAVLAHELAHVEKRHSLKQMSRSLSTYLVFSILTSDASGVSAVIVENAFMIKDLSNSRSMETEADMIGFDYLQDLSIDPNGMVKLFEVLQNQEALLGENMQTALKILSTHPLTQDRINYMQTRIDQLPNQDYVERPVLEKYFKKLK
ncbi:MAG: M48 family metallopeptidase [Saprospiraceae bacterium]